VQQEHKDLQVQLAKQVQLVQQENKDLQVQQENKDLLV
jgi:hypothetical protein